MPICKTCMCRPYLPSTKSYRYALPARLEKWTAMHCLPVSESLASSALSSIYTTWQAMHTCMIWYLASRACTYRFCKLASSVRMAVYNFASSVQIRTCANFCTGSLGTHPKPRDRTSASCAFLQNAVDIPMQFFKSAHPGHL